MRGFFFRFVLCFSSVVLLSCQKKEKSFRLLSARESGIEFVNQLSPTDNLNILTYLYYYNGGGVMIADFNNDNLNDIYFTRNQGPDKLYVNKGNLRFEDVTEKSGIRNSTGWTTGVTHVDINNDGLLDIYVCKVAGHGGFVGENLLFINQGVDDKGIPVFRENAEAYGLNISALSTQAAFFDYDLDGDLDMFLLTHSLHPNRSYGKGENRMLRDSLMGDMLFENVDGKFRDVTSTAGIFQNKISYGLGLAVGDLNKDGFPDIYIGNDFFENDYFYENNGDKTFTELISRDSKKFGHTSHYSMGNCMADINNDALVDIISLDMLPEDLYTLKSSGVEDGYSIYNQFLKNGYSPQYMQNTLHVNKGNGMFSEVAFQAGIAATEWSWGVLAADFDMDGWRDLYITNGILGATNDMDYISFVSQAHIQRDIERRATGFASEFVKQMPQKKASNYAYRNNGEAGFEDVSENWFPKQLSFSNGCAYADLDNDGDLDLVVNNIDQNAFVFENLTNNGRAHNYLTIRFAGPAKNRFGIGARVEIYCRGLFLYEEHFPVRSYLSSVSNEIVLGLGDHTMIDSIQVIWPDFSAEVLYEVEANKTLTIHHDNASQKKQIVNPASSGFIENVDSKISFRHREQSTLDFDRDPLIPFALSNEGPAISVGDINGDGLDDLFIGGAKMQAGELFIQEQSGQFRSVQKELFIKDAKSEDTGSLFLDADNDGDIDLLVVSGGNEFTGGEPLRPRLYINESGEFRRDDEAFNGVTINASVVKDIDIDNDGDTDIVIGSNALPGRFGETSRNYIFENNGSGKFRDITETISLEFANAGLINDVKIADIDGNGFLDIVAVGDWMPVTLFFNYGKSLEKRSIPDSEGWWNTLAIDDFDQDGDLDLVAGNWGHNTRLSASVFEPIELYRCDLDDNGTDETILLYFYKGKQTLLPSKDELAKQIPSIKKKFLSYRDFAAANMQDIFPKEKLKNGMRKEVKLLSTCYFENSGSNTFKHRKLPWGAQSSTVNDIFIDDFNGDGFNDILLVGNNYELSTQLGRLDASHGVLMLNDQSGFFNEHTTQDFDISGPARGIAKVIIKGVPYLVVTINNDSPIFLRKQ